MICLINFNHLCIPVIPHFVQGINSCLLLLFVLLPFTVILERGADQLVSQVKDILCIARLITAVTDLFSGRLPGRSQDLGTLLNFHNSCHFMVGDILIFNSDQMIFSLWSIFCIIGKL